MDLIKKLGIYLLLVIGVVCLFVPIELGISEKYLQVIGICIVMFSLYKVSATLKSKKVEKTTNENLKL